MGRGGEKETKRAGPPKAAVNVFIVSLLALFVIDALPATSGLHATLQRVVDPLLDVTGLWQGNWNLFAPEPDKLNSSITAELRFTDGSVKRWASPDWRAMGVLERARMFRHMEYWDGVRTDPAAWDALAAWLARTEGRTEGGAVLERVALTRPTTVIPPPPASLGLLDRIEPTYLPAVAEPIHERWGPP